jgi:hypothetical protein
MLLTFLLCGRYEVAKQYIVDLRLLALRIRFGAPPKFTYRYFSGRNILNQSDDRPLTSRRRVREVETLWIQHSTRSCLVLHGQFYKATVPAVGDCQDERCGRNRVKGVWRVENALKRL